MFAAGVKLTQESPEMYLYKQHNRVLAEAASTLSQPDAVLDTHLCAKALTNFLNAGGSPEEARDILCGSYVGLPAAAEAVSAIATHLGMDANALMLEALRDFVLEKFNPTAMDLRMMPKLGNSVNTQNWFNDFIQHRIWRNLIYTLLEKHPNCEFLNHAVMRIAEDYPDEVAALRTSSTYLEVFKLILNGSLSDVMNSKDEMEFEEKMPGLARICCANEASYLTAQVLLRRLYEQYDSAPMLRVSEELEKYAREHGHQEFATALKQRITGMPTKLSNAIKTIQQTKQLDMSALNKIYDIYNVQEPPSATYILDSVLIEVLLRAIAVPESSSALSKEDIDKCIYILAKATSSQQFDDPGGPQLHSIKTKHMLEDFHDAVQSSWGEDFKDGLVNLVEAINAPVAAMGVLFFMEYKVFETDYFNNFYQSREIPMPFAIIDEIAEKHPLARSKIFELVKRGLTHKFRLEVIQVIALQKTWVERLVYLVALGYMKPVLIYMRQEGKTLDKGTVAHFMQNVLDIANPPFSDSFTEYMADLILEHQNLLRINRDLRISVVSFADAALISATDFPLETQQRLQHKLFEIKSIGSGLG